MKYLGIIIVLVVILGGAYFLINGGNNEPATLEQGIDAIERAEKLRDSIEGDTTYTIGSGSSASYTAQKEFFSQPTEMITGTTGDVTGVLAFDADTSSLSVNAFVNPQTLESGNNARDTYVRGQFNSDISIVLEGYPLDNGLGSVSALVPVQLTMNNVTQQVDFQIEAVVSESRIEARGEAVIDMRSFGVEPATLAGVYTVDDIATISFDLNAE